LDLRKRRVEKGITQKDLAGKIKKHRSLIAKIESGKSLPSVETAKAIGEVLGFDWSLFYKDNEKKNRHPSEQ
jgi:putative transcriptional regulator